MTDTTTMLDPWNYWRRRMAGEPVQMNPDNPQAGFYRIPRKERYGARKTFTPVIYSPGAKDDDLYPLLPNGGLYCREGDTMVSPERGRAIWQWAGHHPVSEEAYREVADNGGLWPDEHELVGMGHNEPPEETQIQLWTFEELRDRIEDLAREAAERIEGPPIKDQDECDRVANLADRLAELDKEIERRYKEERAPLDLALKDLRVKWASIQLRAETYKNLKYKLITPYLKQLQRDAEEAAKEAAAAGAPTPVETRRPRAGTRGRAMSLKSHKRAEITDYPAALEFFRDSPDVVAAVQSLADRAVRSGIAVPGTKVIEEEKAV
jgi:hypothetical protein